MVEISKLSSRFSVRRMDENDADEILELCLGNTQFYEYCGRQPTKELILDDLRLTPSGKELSDKYYVGFYDENELVAVMDLVDGYPTSNCCFIGFFMMNKGLQGRGLGTELIGEALACLKGFGFKTARLAIDKENPQSTHFWKKNGFIVIKEVERDGSPVLVAERKL